MKRFAVSLAAVIMAFSCVFSQNVTFTTDGDVYRPTASSRTGVGDNEPTQTPYFYELSSKKYPIFMSKSGSCWILRISQKSGKEYRSYLGEEISRDICAKMNREYTPRKK